jgi:HAE1 family hydrophobic/amphiphilic exporter-1
LAVTAGVTALNFLGLFLIRRETMPDVDQNQFLMRFHLPPGTRLEVTDRVVATVERVLKEVPEVGPVNVVGGSADQTALGALGPHQAQLIVDLRDRVARPSGRTRARKRTARQVMGDVSQRLKTLDLEGARVDFEAQGGDVFSELFGKADADAVLEVKSSDPDRLKSATASLTERLRKIGGVARVENSVTVPALQIRYRMDEDKLARDGLSVSDVAESVLQGLHGAVPTALREQGREIPLRVRLRSEDRASASALANVMIANPLDRSSHPLSEYGALEMSPGPSEIRRRDQTRTILLSVFLNGAGREKALAKVRAMVAGYQGRSDVTVSLGGDAEEVSASFNSLIIGFVAAVFLVYIVLVAQFNTLWVPLLAMVAVPLSINGVTPALFLTGHSLNLMSGQGLMILSGIVVNNSLMLLEFIQQRRETGASPEDAAREASHTRLRPIFMTVIGNMAGLTPLALALGEGAAMQAPMAVTVIFGLAVSTALTLLVLPALYLEARAYFEK